MATSVDSFKDLEELGIDCENNDSLTVAFNQAANRLQTLLPNVDNQTLLTLYSYYKQGSEGPCNVPKPSWYDLKAKSKWEAWNKLGSLPQNDAKTLYIEEIKKLDPDFEGATKESWVSVSVLQDKQELEEADKNLFDYVKEGNKEQVLKILKSSSVNPNKIDEDGLGLVHWASDRGSAEVLRVLFDFGADANLQDSDGQTALHYAASCSHVDCIKLLLDQGARKDVLDCDEQRPLDVATDAAVKELLK